MLASPVAINPRMVEQEAVPTFEEIELDVDIPGALTPIYNPPCTGDITIAHPASNTAIISYSKIYLATIVFIEHCRHRNNRFFYLGSGFFQFGYFGFSVFHKSNYISPFSLKPK